jgi:hypothetical protein
VELPRRPGRDRREELAARIGPAVLDGARTASGRGAVMASVTWASTGSSPSRPAKLANAGQNQ